MKYLQKLILPLLLLTIIFIIYLFYFAPGGLGSFADFDPNNSAVKSITVKIIKNADMNHDGNSFIFYVHDKNKNVMQVNSTSALPDGFETAEIITIKGHLSSNSFHAHEILID